MCRSKATKGVWMDKINHGHTSIFRRFYLAEKTDYCISFDGSIHFYTGGLKLDNRVGSWGAELTQRILLSANPFANQFTVVYFKWNWWLFMRPLTVSTQIIVVIFCALRAVDSIYKTTEDKSLKAMGKQLYLNIVTVHCNIPDNALFIRNGTSLPLSLFGELLQFKMEKSQYMQEAKIIWTEWNGKRSHALIVLKIKEITTVIGHLTGHILLGRHGERLGNLWRLEGNSGC